MLTQYEVFNILLKEEMLRQSLRDIYPGAPEYNEDKLRRKATQFAVKNTWQWFNKQDELKKRMFFPSKGMEC